MAISSPFTKMLSHKLRAENDAILVGRITDERDHSQLNVRDWSGKGVTVTCDSSAPMSLITGGCVP